MDRSVARASSYPLLDHSYLILFLALLDHHLFLLDISLPPPPVVSAARCVASSSDHRCLLVLANGSGYCFVAPVSCYVPEPVV
jgi:hypothetical protein